ncbi:glycosyltransferase family 2 protein [Nocardioides yefusunii]|uniref:Glycosyltransferase family 2 protein n=1 Tax=Nocardioides yefusunii TaxID=2500546 RepID=A0ABW1R140_9ACTN|nr:glycosyltransferase family 2 protein [Nocardioides yefusunii]
MIVSAVLVTHDGARWLPQVLEGLASQTRPVDRVVAVDTGSRDETPELLRPVIGESRTVTAPVDTGYPTAVRLGLDLLGPAERPEDEWVWLLHDDSAPAPDALEQLLRVVAERPEADVLGPKLREWPSLRRLLELGVTISGTGRRETGLELGEFDQGQHDDVRQVLAVNTAGMLVRRAVLDELGGLDEAMGVFGNDLDFGWRAAAAGHTTLVAPGAVVFHAEAAHRGLRRTPLTGKHTHYAERRAALLVLLSNVESRRLLWTTLRLAVGSVLRVLGLLLTRQVGQSLDELAALVNVYARPGTVRAARARRRAARGGSAEAVDALRPPWWLPYRHGLDAVQEIASAVVGQAHDVADRRRAAKAEEAAAHGPAPVVAPRTAPGLDAADDDEDMYDDTGIVVRFLTNPIAVLVSLFVLVSLVAARAAVGDISGGALSPVPAGGTADWWRLHVESRHPLGTGTDVPAPGYVAVLALAGIFTGGNAVAVMSTLMLLAVPVALWGAWRFLRLVGRLVDPDGINRWVLTWGSVTYALLPATSGAWGEGRFGTVVLAALLPWLAHAALGFADPEPARRWRAAWRTGLLLALSAAFVPAVWLFALLAAAIVVAAGFAIAPALLRERSAWGPPALALGLVPLLLLPWLLSLVATGSFAGLFLEAGRLPVAAVDFTDLLSGRLSSLGAPGWFGIPVLVLAVLALVPGATRIPVTIGWLVALPAAVVVAVLGAVVLHLPATDTPPSLGFFVVVIQGAFLTAATLGAGAMVRRLHRSTASGYPLWQRGVAGVAAAAAAVVPVAGLGWWLVAPNSFGVDEVEVVPAYMAQSSLDGDEHGVLVLRGSVEDGLTYRVRRGDGVTVGEDEILGLADEDQRLTGVVQGLASAPVAEHVIELAGLGIEYVVMPGPVDGRVSGGLDAVDGLVQASAGDRNTRAWRVDHSLDGSAVSSHVGVGRVLLVVVQAVLFLVTLVAAGPSFLSARRRA